MKQWLLRLRWVGLGVGLAWLLPVDAATANPRDLEIHEARGVVKSISRDGRKAVIRHEEIPGYMAAMTMELTVKDPNEVRGILPGDTITFRLLADKRTHWIDTLRKVGSVPSAPADPKPAPAPTPTGEELRKGDLMPEVQVTGESGDAVPLSRFRGQALAFTFIFTRCPLPDFCPLMNNHFAEARRILRKDRSGPTNWHFLSISFDPEFDTPEVLRRYAKTYRGGDPDRWLFSVASTNTVQRVSPQLDLMIGRAGGTISHNLRTVVLDARGRIHRQFDGNRWTAAELAAAMTEAARINSDPIGQGTRGQ